MIFIFRYVPVCVIITPIHRWEGRTRDSPDYWSHWSSMEVGCHSDRNLICGTADARHLLHSAAVGLVGRTLHQYRAGIGHSGLGGHADRVTGRGRGRKGGGGWVERERLATVCPTLRLHLDRVIPEFRKSQRKNKRASGKKRGRNQDYLKER